MSFLCLYRMLELIYKKNGDWSDDYRQLVGAFEAEFHATRKTGRNLLTYIEIVRNRCANGRFRYKQGSRAGLTKMDAAGLAELQQVWPLVFKMGQEAFNRIPDNPARLALQHDRTWQSVSGVNV